MHKKPVCVSCQQFYRRIKTGVWVIEGMPACGKSSPPPGTAQPESWRPYKLWHADLFECQGCKTRIIGGFGSEPVTEHYKDGFAGWLERTAGPYQFTVNDC
jgi:hypothetical protein